MMGISGSLAGQLQIGIGGRSLLFCKIILRTSIFSSGVRTTGALVTVLFLNVQRHFERSLVINFGSGMSQAI